MHTGYTGLGLQRVVQDTYIPVYNYEKGIIQVWKQGNKKARLRFTGTSYIRNSKTFTMKLVYSV